ncbi:MAG: hypothetical protein AAF577_06480 [Pseudomonadota bacterium]
MTEAPAAPTRSGASARWVCGLSVPGLLGLAAMALSGCLPSGEGALGPVSGARGGGGDFALVSSAPRKAVIRAAGRPVAVTPAAGACVADDAIDVSGGSAFVLLTDCLLVPTSDESGIDPVGDSLAQPFAGLVTVSLAGGPRGSINELQSFVESELGRRRLARGAEDSLVEIASVSQLGNALYVHAVSSGENAMPLLSRDFWRCFLELNGRMAVVTVSGFDGSGLTAEDLFAEARRHSRALIAGNPAGRQDAIIARLTDTSPARPQTARRAFDAGDGVSDISAPLSAAPVADAPVAPVAGATVADLGSILLVERGRPAGEEVEIETLPPRRPGSPARVDIRRDTPVRLPGSGDGQILPPTRPAR